MLPCVLSERARQVLSRTGLYLGLIIYAAVGGKIFQELESPSELASLQSHHTLLMNERELFLQSAVNSSCDGMESLSLLLRDYEVVLAEAVNAGISAADHNYTVSWDYIQSVFFTTTILTTIGYGNISPVTFHGRLFCIFFAIIGIPFTLSVLSDLGQILATIIGKVWEQYKEKVKPVLEKYKILKEPTWDKEEDIGLSNNLAIALGSLLILICFLSIGAYFFSVYEDINFFDAFYFCFITMTTIGFGDIVPSLHTDAAAYMLLSTVYIIVGMTVFTAIIEIVRRQYEESWRKMQQIKIQIQAQIRLADSLAKMGAQGGLDEAGTIELETIRNNLVKHKVKLGKEFDNFAVEEADWVDASDKRVRVVTFILYETSL